MNKKCLILGNSNLSRFPPFANDQLQVESYTGANVRHAEIIIKKATIYTEVEQVIMAFGLYNRSLKERLTLSAQMGAAVEHFPSAVVWVPLNNFSILLLTKQKNLRFLDSQIRKSCLFIPVLPSHLFSTLKDHVHWTKATAKHMLQH